jgi:hypothetical protein
MAYQWPAWRRNGVANENGTIAWRNGYSANVSNEIKYRLSSISMAYENNNGQ